MSIIWSVSAFHYLQGVRAALSPERRRLLDQHVTRVLQALNRNPLEHGESRDEGRRLWYTGLLTLLFRIRKNGDVRVLAVTFYDKSWSEYE